MHEVRLVYEFKGWGRRLYLSVVSDLAAWSPDLSHVPSGFAAFCALDECEMPTTLETFAEQLVRAGCKDVYSWGPEADGVEYEVDNAFIRMTPDEEWEDRFVGTTAFRDETLDETLHQVLFFGGMESDAVVAITSPQYSEQVERRLRDPDQLARDLFDDID